jgi:hypothetical protein
MTLLPLALPFFHLLKVVARGKRKGQDRNPANLIKK